MIVTFNKPPQTGNEKQYLLESLENDQISGDGPFAKRCHQWFESNLNTPKALLTSSCTHALEIAALLLDISPGDEVIMPSYTFVSTANAFALRGAKIVFVDINPTTMNIDETLIEAAITPRTKAIVPVHYAGVACNMDVILDISERHSLTVVEDAAQGIGSTYKGKPLGTIGHLGAISFHETKNITSGGEGGLLLVNTPSFIDRSEILREKGTNRNQFFRGMVDKYSWVDLGSSYLMNDLSAAYLWGQLEDINTINTNRLKSWERYYKNLEELANSGHISLPSHCKTFPHNAHMFFIKVDDLATRSALLSHLKQNNILAVFHYIPLHSSPAGVRLGRFNGEDTYTTTESEKLIRLPLYYGLSEIEIDYVTESVISFFKSK